MNLKKLTVYKPNELIEIEGGYLTTLNLLAYNYILHRLQLEGKNNIIISGADFFNNLEMSKNYDELVLYLDSLQKIRVVSRDNKGKLWGAFNLLSSFKKLENGNFYIEIPQLVFNSLCNNDNLYYTTIKLLEQKSFKCVYSAIFYEIFKKYEKINIPIFILEDLKTVTGTKDKYKTYYDFKRYVLDKALKELNNFYTDFNYTFDEEYLGRKVNKIRFIRTPKNIIEIPVKQLSIKLLKAIEKSRKNRFIDECYSQKAIEKILQKYDEKDIIKALGELYKYNSEIKSFSKILTAKIEDIKNSKMAKIKENQGYTLGRKEVGIPLKFDIIEPKKSDLDIEKEKVSNLIRNSGLPTNQRLFLMGELDCINNLKELEKFKIEKLK